jgi:short-subunit dehydrogenase
MSEKKALVTGASSGIGAEFARALARDGYRVTGVARSEDKLKDLVREIGQHHRFLIADLSDAGQLRKVADDVEREGYDLVVNNAGYGIYGRFEDIPLDRQQNLMSVNMNALVTLSHAFLRTARSGSGLINVSSVLSLLTYPGGAVYAASKAFVTNFTESLWYEYKDRGVFVMALLPGLTDTRFHEVATGGKDVPLPNGPVYSAATVVRDALAGFTARRSPVVLSGPLVFASTRLAGRKMLTTVMGNGSVGLRMRSWQRGTEEEGT